jgi:predicted O-methyltransferase YrrM
MASEDTQVDRSDILSHLMSKDGQQPRDEPAIAANIGQQLQHMGLTTWSISIHRRLRDALVRLSPQSVLEVGASIGHRTAWLLDAFEREQRPKYLTLVEQGAKFGVILHRLVTRYDALNWTDIVVGEPLQLAADHAAWSIATTISTELSETKFQSAYDAIIIDGPSPQRAELVKTYLPMLSPNGVLFTKEPDMPTGDVDPEDEQGMALVNGFNAWMDLIRETQVSHHVAFMPLFGGTLVAWLPVS